MSSVLLKWILMCIFCIQALSAEKWRVEVRTGSQAGANTDGNIYLQLVGEIESSHEYLLDGPGNDFEKGAINVFEVNSPPLGHLQSVKMSYTSQDGWFLVEMVLKRLITNRTCVFEFQNWFTKTFSWDARNKSCAYVVGRSSSSDMISQTRKLSRSLGLLMVRKTSAAYFYQTSATRTLTESSRQNSRAAQMSTELYPSSSSSSSSSSSMNEQQAMTASEELKRPITNNPVVSLATSRDMQVTSELDMSQTLTPLLFTTETFNHSNILESFQMEQTSTGLDPILNPANVFSTNSIPGSFSYTPASSTQDFVSSSKLCTPWIQVIESETFPTENSSCVCHLMNFSSLSRDAKIRQIIKELTVDPKSLSKYKRKKISAPDHRISAQAIGYVGVVTLVAPFALIVILDFMTFTKYYFGN